MKVFKAPNTQSYITSCPSQVRSPDCTLELPGEVLKNINGHIPKHQ